MLTPEELSTLQAIIAREQARPDPAAIDAGDIVQIRPSADRVFGGMLVSVMKADAFTLRGYLLRPHRGACREAWLKLNPCEVLRVGPALYDAGSTFARRCDARGPRCKYAPC